MGGRAQRLPRKRTQKGRRSVCDLFSWFVFVVVALCFCSSSLEFFFFFLSFLLDTLYRSISLGWRGAWGGGRSASPANEHRKDVVLFVTCSLGLCLWLLFFAFVPRRCYFSVFPFRYFIQINFSWLEGSMGGRAQRLPRKRTQKGRRSVCDLFSWFVFVVVALCFCSSSLEFFFFCLSF